MLDAIGGRKFLLALVVIAVGTAVQIIKPGAVDPSFTALLIGVFGAFSASNVYAQKNAPAVEEAQQEPSVATDEQQQQPALKSSDVVPIFQELSARISEMSTRAESHAAAITTLQQAVDTTQKLARTAIGLKS